MTDYHALLVAELECQRTQSEAKNGLDPTFKTLKSPFEPFEGAPLGGFRVREVGDPSTPAEYALPLANFSNSPAPGDFDAAHWQETLDGMAAFCAEWGSRAAALGWLASELFSLDDRAPAARHDRRGLALSLAGGARMMGIDADGADVEMPSGSRLRFYRRPGQ